MVVIARWWWLVSGNESSRVPTLHGDRVEPKDTTDIVHDEYTDLETSSTSGSISEVRSSPCSKPRNYEVFDYVYLYATAAFKNTFFVVTLDCSCGNNFYKKTMIF